MPIDRISRPSSLLETMRALARDRANGSTSNLRKTSTDQPTDGTSVSAKPQIKELRQRLHNLMAHVDTHDAHALAEAREPALREILLWEFGNDFRQDSQFLPMVEAINKALDADPQFPQRFAELVASLRKN